MDKSEYCFFPKELSSIVKGIAIILMFALHLLKPEWMLNPEMIIDINIGDTFLAAILSRGGDICIGIFAFITGYGWNKSSNNKTVLSRILGPGGIYRTYWFILLTFSFPVRFLMNYIVEGKAVELTFTEVLSSLLAISSISVKFQWYIYFFALAALTYRPVYQAVCHIKLKPIIKIYTVCFISLAMRIMYALLFKKTIQINILTSVSSHYFQWMPVVLMGGIVQDERAFELMEENAKYNKTKAVLLQYLCIIIYVAKCFFCYFTKLYINLDSFIMLPFMYSLLLVSKKIYSVRFINNVFSFFGGLSTYMWLMHRVLLYQPMQIIIEYIRIPVLILIFDLYIMSALAYLEKKAEYFIQTRIRNTFLK